MSLPDRKTLSARERLQLIKFINGLPSAQFSELIYALSPPAGVLSAATGAQGARAVEFLEWAEGPTGPGIQEVVELIREYIGPNKFDEEFNRSFFTSTNSSRTIESKQKLYKALLKLGYRQQARLFRAAIDSESIAAFLIYGLPDYGQEWLLNRLVYRNIKPIMNEVIVKVELASRLGKIDPSEIWYQLGAKLGQNKRPPPRSDVIERLKRTLKTRHVIVILNNVHILPERDIQKIIIDFWLPLISDLKKVYTDTETRKLLMFLVDYGEIADSWNIPLVEKLEANWNPQQPIKPPKLEEFKEEELREWLEDEFRDLPPELVRGIDMRVEENLKMILDNSDGGIPEFAFYQICYLCGLNWYDEKEKWLRI